MSAPASQTSLTDQTNPAAGVPRRHFLKAAAGVTAAAMTGLTDVAAEPRSRPVPKGRPALIDTNVTLSRWPFRRLPLDQTPALVSKLRSYGVLEAWAGTFDALLHKDLGSANARLAEECHRHGHGVLRPFGSVNPALPDWEEELRRCHEQHEMTGIRLHPNYHGYTLEDKRFAKLLDAATERGLLVQLAVLMEDERMQHPLLRVPHVDVTPLFALLDGRPKARIELLNWSRGVKAPLLPRLADAGHVFFEVSSVESVGGVANLLKEVPRERVLFGSHAPFFYFESAWLKLQESELTRRQAGAIREGNARQLLA